MLPADQISPPADLRLRDGETTRRPERIRSVPLDPPGTRDGADDDQPATTDARRLEPRIGS
jgi:hypothetical protein